MTDLYELVTDPDSLSYHKGRVLGPFPAKIWRQKLEEDGKREFDRENFVSHYSFPLFHETSYLSELPI